MQIGPGEKMSEVFQESQPPAYIELIRSGNWPLIVGCYKKTVVWFMPTNFQEVDNMFKMSRDDYLLEYSIVFEFAK